MAEWNKGGISYGTQLGILLGLTGAGLLASVFASFGIWQLMVGSSIPTSTSEILQPKYYDVNMVMQGVSTFFIFFLPAIFYAWICYNRPARFIGFTNRYNYKQVLLVFGILLVAIPLAGAIGELNRIIPLPANWEASFKKMEEERRAQEEALIKIDSLRKYIISLFMIGLLPAIFEETFFRGGLQNLLTRWLKGPWLAIIITSVIFSLIHVSYYGFLVRFSLGVILGLLFYYSKNLWLPVIFHLLFNGLQVTMLYIMTKSGIKRPKELEDHFPIWIGIVSLGVLIYLFRIYKQKSVEAQLKYAVAPGDVTPHDDAQNQNN